ncbi:MAG: GGDEF domain-containing protein [Magnetococcales bacterium]|nr:GGDEF domain-containing protein [Magnetococcales bacterium]
MKVFNTIYRGGQKIRNFILENDIHKLGNLLVQVYSGVLDRGFIYNILSELHQYLPDAIIVGATTTGEIIDGASQSDSVIISFSAFNSSQVAASVLIDGEISNVGCIVNKNTKMFLLLSAGIDVIPSELLTCLGHIAPSAIVVGGCAGDNDRLKESLIFHGKDIIGNGAVVVSISGESLFVKQFMKFNWEPMGSEMIITDSHMNIVRTINGYKVTDLYRYYFGGVTEDNLISISSVFPLMIKRGNMYISRILLDIDETTGSCHFSGIMNVGEHVVFGYANVDMLLDDAYLDGKVENHIESIWMFSCGGRKKILHKSIDQEIAAVSRIAPVSGFFTYGEYFTHEEGHHEVLNNTMTFVGISENPVPRQYILPRHQETSGPNLLDVSPRKIFQAITHFANTVTKERDDSYREMEQYAKDLDVKNSQLERLYMTDRLTGVYNRYKLDATLSELMKSYNRYGNVFSVVLGDVDKFKSINDRFGHNVGDAVLCKIAELIRSHVRDTDVFGRWGGEEFMLICSETRLEGAYEIAEKIRRIIEKNPFNDVGNVTASFGVSQCTDDDTVNVLVGRADKALYSAKNRGRNRVEREV